MIRHKRNPHELTFRQHVFPVASLKRFANVDGRLPVYLVREQRHIPPVRLNDELFCARRAWSHHAEARFMTSLEGPFQALADRIVAGQDRLDASDCHHATLFYALWVARVAARELRCSDQVLTGVHPGHAWSDYEAEGLERKGFTVLNDSGAIPGRFFVGLWVQHQVSRLTRGLGRRTWGVLRAQCGEFVLPDRPGDKVVIPIAPRVCLASGHASRTLGYDDIADTNGLLAEGAVRYLAARDFAAVLGWSDPATQARRSE